MPKTKGFRVDLVCGPFFNMDYFINIISEGLKWQGKEGNIPSQPILLTVPKSLELQFTNELRRYLRPKSFDILPYTGTWEKRQSWWTGVWSASKHDLSRRIVVAATTVGFTHFRFNFSF
jgi:hypothetical protein